MTNNQRVKSPYFKNALETDDFEDKVHLLKNNPHIIAVAFHDKIDSTPNFDITTKGMDTEQEMFDALLYSISKIAEGKGFSINISVQPIKPLTPELIDLVSKMFHRGRFLNKPPTP